MVCCPSLDKCNIGMEGLNEVQFPCAPPVEVKTQKRWLVVSAATHLLCFVRRTSLFVFFNKPHEYQHNVILLFTQRCSRNKQNTAQWNEDLHVKGIKSGVSCFTELGTRREDRSAKINLVQQGAKYGDVRSTYRH